MHLFKNRSLSLTSYAASEQVLRVNRQQNDKPAVEGKAIISLHFFIMCTVGSIFGSIFRMNGHTMV